MKNSTKTTQLIVALDVDTWEEARQIILELGNSCNFYKIGYQLFFREGMGCVNKILESNKKIFLDLKLGDIPRTIASAVQAIPKGVSMISIQGDPTSVSVARQERPDLEVFYLRSLSSSRSIEEMDESLVAQSWYEALDAGAQGLIVSGDYLRLFLQLQQTVKSLASVKIISPGIRLETQENNDHLATITPQQARQMMIDYIVVGRPIVHASNRLKEIEKFI
ncbi:MAG: orotidine-5'-phosphate decarboxylase [Methylacidiphilales bacterium]|nr:orotidine-5'-phosphate decarboxylase [Candidatus Methylacidiphilales bacterium]